MQFTSSTFSSFVRWLQVFLAYQQKHVGGREERKKGQVLGRFFLCINFRHASIHASPQYIDNHNIHIRRVVRILIVVVILCLCVIEIEKTYPRKVKKDSPPPFYTIHRGMARLTRYIALFLWGIFPTSIYTLDFLFFVSIAVCPMFLFFFLSGSFIVSVSQSLLSPVSGSVPWGFFCACVYNILTSIASGSL